MYYPKTETKLTDSRGGFSTVKKKTKQENAIHQYQIVAEAYVSGFVF